MVAALEALRLFTETKTYSFGFFVLFSLFYLCWKIPKSRNKAFLNMHFKRSSKNDLYHTVMGNKAHFSSYLLSENIFHSSPSLDHVILKTWTKTRPNPTFISPTLCSQSYEIQSCFQRLKKE